MHCFYIRLLKCPKLIQHEARKYSLQLTLTIVTDLGEKFYPHDETLQVKVVHAVKHRNVATKDVQWKAAMRALPVNLSLASWDGKGPVKVEINSKSRFTSSWIRSDGIMVMPEIVSVESAPMAVERGILEAPRLAIRKVVLSNGQTISVCEDTGNSIAYHVWDAAMALVPFLDYQFLPNYEKTKSEASINVIELGTGCGLVGLGVAKLLPGSNVVLTDIGNVEEFITRHNIPADAQNVSYCHLDWTSSIPDAVLNRRFDLILVADCIYSTDSIPGLVRTLDLLEKQSPGAELLIARKPRHSSELIFFDLMTEASFKIQHEYFVQAQSDPDDLDEQDGEKIHIYMYGRTGR